MPDSKQDIEILSWGSPKGREDQQEIEITKWGKEPTWGDVGMDVLASPVGLVKGGIGLAGMGGDLREAGAKYIPQLIEWGGGKLGIDPEKSKHFAEQTREQTLGGVGASLPTSADIRKRVEDVTGPLYEPRTKTGKVLHAGVEAVPAGLALGAGGLAARAGLYGLAPGMTSEVAGQTAQSMGASPATETAARIGGAFAGPLAASSARRFGRPVEPISPYHERQTRILDDADIRMTAGQRTGDPWMLWSESMAGRQGKIAQERGLEDFTRYQMARTGQQGVTRAGQDEVAQAFRDNSNLYNQITARNAAQPDRQMFIDTYDALNRYRGGVSDMFKVRDVERIAGEIANNGRRVIDGQQYQQWRSQLGQLAMGTTDGTARGAIRDMQAALDNAMARSIARNNPRDIGAFQEANRQYAALMQLTGPIATAREGLLTGPRVRQAETADREGRRAFIQGATPEDRVSRAAADILPEMPSSGTAQRTQAHAAFMIPGAIAGAGGTQALTGDAPSAGIVGAITGALTRGASARALMSPLGQAYLGGQLPLQQFLRAPQQGLVNRSLRGGAVGSTAPEPENGDPLRITVTPKERDRRSFLDAINPISSARAEPRQAATQEERDYLADLERQPERQQGHQYLRDLADLPILAQVHGNKAMQIADEVRPAPTLGRANPLPPNWPRAMTPYEKLKQEEAGMERFLDVPMSDPDIQNEPTDIAYRQRSIAEINKPLAGEAEARANLSGPGKPQDWISAVRRSDLTDKQAVRLAGITGESDPRAMYHHLASTEVDQGDLAKAKSAMGPKAWSEFAGAKIRSLGRAKPTDPFDPAAFAAAWEEQPKVFKSLLDVEHRKAIDQAIKNGALEKLQAQVGGNQVVTWLEYPEKAKAVASWGESAKGAMAARDEQAHERLMAPANERLMKAVAAPSVARDDDPFTRAAAQRRGEVSQRGDNRIDRLAGIPAGMVHGVVDMATLGGDVVQGKYFDKSPETDIDGQRQAALDAELRKRSGDFATNLLGLGGPIAMAGGAKGAVGRFFSGGDPAGAQFGIFGGRGARTADLQKLAQAQTMAKEGASPTEILQATGWEKDAAGAWQFEMSDHRSQFREQPKPQERPQQGELFNDAITDYRARVGRPRSVEKGPSTVGEAFDHPELYKAYPQLADMEYKNLPEIDFLRGSLGGYTPPQKSPISELSVPPNIELGTPNQFAHAKSQGFDVDRRSGMLHELQHAVDEIEGFTPGSSTRSVPVRRAAEDRINQAQATAQDLFNEILNRQKRYIQEQMAAGSELGPIRLGLKYLKENPREARFLDRMQQGGWPAYHDQMKHDALFDAYKRVAGETKARNVETRRDMDPEERVATPSWETQDFPFERQIVLDKMGRDVQRQEYSPGIGHNQPPAEYYTPKSREGIGAVNLRELPIDQALEIARSERHIIPSGTREGFVGAPASIKTRADIEAARKRFDALVEEGIGGADWYQRGQASVKEIAGPDPRKQSQLADELALTSSQSAPGPNLGMQIRARNAFQAGRPVEVLRNRDMAASYNIARTEGDRIKLGPKTDIYAGHLDPTRENPKTGTNDIWHGRSLGYSLKETDNGFNMANHHWMDAETMLAVDRFNKRKFMGRDDWTAGEIQAAPWVAMKARDLETRLGWSREEALAEARKSYGEHFDQYTAFGTHESTPYIGANHHPGLVRGSAEERQRFADDPRSTWQGPGGRDMIYDAFGMDVRPSTKAQGIYQPPEGALETNPAEVARPLVGLRRKPEGYQYEGAASRHPRKIYEAESSSETVGPRTRIDVDDESRAMMNAAEAFRAYVDAQGAGAWSKPIAGNTVEQSRSLEIGYDKKMTPEQILALKRTGQKYGYEDAVDYGKGGAMTTFYPEPPASKDVSKALKGGLTEEIQSLLPGSSVARRDMAAGYIPFEEARAACGGAVTRELEKYLTHPDFPRAIEHLDASKEIKAKVLAKLQQSAERAAQAGDPASEVIQNARMIIASPGGVKKLFEVLRTHPETLPVALLTVQAMQEVSAQRE